MNLRFLKVLVVVMGVLIVIGILVVAVTIYNRVTRMGDGPPAEAPDGQPVELAIPLPSACEIQEMEPVGNRMVLRVGPGRACQELLIVDPRSGALTARIRFPIAP